MNVTDFVAKWGRVELTERSASQQHFLDMCELFDHPKPAEADPLGNWFTFERGAAKHGGGDGWADVWKREFFGWEYKGKHKDLDGAYDQLLKYREALENPPLLVVCDMDRIIIRTNFTATATQTYDIPLSEFGTSRNIEIMRRLFHEPDKLRPGVTSEAITTEVAERLGEIAQGLRHRGLDPTEVARFLDRIVFCLFAEDVGLLPPKLFSRIVDNARRDAERFAKMVEQLFQAMAEGSYFGADLIRHFNGNLFTTSRVLALSPEEMDNIQKAAQFDWSAVDPSIFGTLFERGLDPEKRSQLGAQYTSREDIETVVDPVVMKPLRDEWAEVKRRVENLLTTGKREPSGKERPLTIVGEKRARRDAEAEVRRWIERLSQVKVLDPACGSGNFLYVTLQKLKDIEKEALVYAGTKGLRVPFLLSGPWQFFGIEVNPYAYDLAQTTLWIGYLQWIRANGFNVEADPVLRPMDNFRCMDAILDLSDPDNSKEPEWPKVDFIVGNPPFLGTKRLRSELGDQYVEKLFAAYGSRIPNFSDLCCYWFEKSRKQIEEGNCNRAGLLATQGIRGGLNRETLKRIKQTGDIFFAESDRDWILDGASVHVSIVGFDNGTERLKVLDGKTVLSINPNLTASADTTQARKLNTNRAIGFIADVKSGQFDIPESESLLLVSRPNPTGNPNSDVLTPWVNGLDILRRPRNYWIIDFGPTADLKRAAGYEAPFEIVKSKVYPLRSQVKRKRYREYWWLHAEPCAEMRDRLRPLERFIVTPTVSKHRVFAWLKAPTLPDHQLVAFARSDDYFFGVLHSRVHEVWARAQGTQVRERESGFRYTPTTCFETFPFPEPTVEEQAAIAETAREINEARNEWLNPSAWTEEKVLKFPGSVDGPWARYVHHPNERGVGTVRYSQIVPKDDDCDMELAKRTLTKLYNERPTWLDLLHTSLDKAVLAAYGWDSSVSDEEILSNLLNLNIERALKEERALTSRRAD